MGRGGKAGPARSAPDVEASWVDSDAALVALIEELLGVPRYALDTGSKLGIALGARAKIATADETRGLGSGGNDYGLSLDLYRRVGDTLLFAGAGHDWLGDSPRIQAGTQQRASVGFSHGTGDGQ